MKDKTSSNFPGQAPRRTPRFLFPLLIFLLLAGLWWRPAMSAPGENYEALRLLTEALYEVSQKYVWPRSEGEMLQGGMRGMMNSLDPDSSFLTAEEFKEFQHGNRKAEAEAGLELVVKENLITVVAVLDGGPAAKAGLKSGDHLLKINDKIVRNLTTQEISRRFRGPAGTVVKVQLLRNGLVKPLDLSVTLGPLPPPRVTAQILKDQFAYIRVPYFTEETPSELAAVLKPLKGRQPPLKGILLDLRNNARGTMEQAVRTASVLLGDKEIVSTKGRQGDANLAYRGKARDLVFEAPIPMVVLVDQGTARAAEIVAAALHHYKLATLVGAKTFGLGGITKAFALKDGSALLMTVAYCYTPGGQRITGTGLEPEVAGKKPPSGAGPLPVPPPNPEQDPWVQQGLEILTTGKIPPAAPKKS